MKKLLLVLSIFFASITSFAQIVSTGLGTVGSIDGWKVGTTSPATGSTYVLPISMFSGIWEPVPVSGTGAKWISLTPTGIGNGMTDYFYEKSFGVSSGIKEVKCNFKVAADDQLKKVELVDGSGAAASIPFTLSPTGYRFTDLITGSVKCPKAGEWKLRITVFCGDPKGSQGPTALLVSGEINLIKGSCPPPPCNCPKGWLSNTTNQDGGVTTDGRCKKLVCKPIGVLPPPNGTQVGNWGFTWGNELWAYGTKENGGAVICDDKDSNNSTLWDGTIPGIFNMKNPAIFVRSQQLEKLITLLNSKEGVKAQIGKSANGSYISVIKQLKENYISQAYEIKDTGPMDHIIGVKITCEGPCPSSCLVVNSSGWSCVPCNQENDGPYKCYKVTRDTYMHEWINPIDLYALSPVVVDEGNDEPASPYLGEIATRILGETFQVVASEVKQIDNEKYLLLFASNGIKSIVLINETDSKGGKRITSKKWAAFYNDDLKLTGKNIASLIRKTDVNGQYAAKISYVGLVTLLR